MKKAHIKIDSNYSASEYHSQNMITVNVHTNERGNIKLGSVNGDTVYMTVDNIEAGNSSMVTMFIPKEVVKELVYDLIKLESELENSNDDNR